MKNKILSLLVIAILAMSISVLGATITESALDTDGTTVLWNTSSRFIIDLTEDSTYVYAAYSVKGIATFSTVQLGLTVDPSKVLPWNPTSNTVISTTVGATVGSLKDKDTFIPSGWLFTGSYRAGALNDYTAAYYCPPAAANISIASGVTQPIFKAVFKKQLGYTNIQNSGLAIYSGTIVSRATYIKSAGAKTISNVETTVSTTGYNAPIATYYSWNATAPVSDVTVTFKDYDNTTILGTSTFASGGNATAPANPTRTGYTFSGWDSAITGVNASKTVIAVYTKNEYTVTFKDYNGTILKTQTNVPYQTAATAPADPTRDRYDFTGWDVTFNDITGDTIVTAQYTASTVVKVPETGVVSKGQIGVPVKVRNGNVIEDGTVNGTVVSIPAKILATVTNQAQLEAADFGIIFGTVKFRFKVEAGSEAYNNIYADDGRYFIKLVDPNGTILSGKTFKARNYFGTTESAQEIDVTIAAN